MVSHVCWQQNGSAAQTSAQHVALLHAGVLWGVKQLPELLDPQSWQSRFAASTHAASHDAVQQDGSMVHTVEQQVGSEQPGVGWTVRHDPIAPPGHWAAEVAAGMRAPATMAQRFPSRIAQRIPAVSLMGRLVPSAK